MALRHKALGESLFNEVCRHLNLLETDYFGLEFNDCFNNRCWLDKDKPILRQITNKQSDARFAFVVKFYTPNPGDLEEEYTRYLLALQIRRDLANGELRCNYNTAALMAAHIVQSDCGDFNADDYPDHTYLTSGRFVPNQTVDFLKVVRENHMKLMGMSPAESDLALLEIARRCEFYGVKLHEAKDVEDTVVGLSVAHMGIRVFHQMQCVSTFSWAKIRKLSFKRRKMLIKLHPESYQYYKETIEFSFENRNECKNFWKKCVEHHAFFRCLEVVPQKKSKESKLFSRGSSFRYRGKTQKQLIDYVREHRKRREPFSRPIKPGLSSQQVLYSKPSRYINSGYSTVSDCTIKAAGGWTLPKHQQQTDSQPSCSYVHDLDVPQQQLQLQQQQQYLHQHDSGTVRSSNLRATHSELSSSRNHSNTLTQKHSSGAVSDGEYMYSSDIEPNTYCTAPIRYKQTVSLKQLRREHTTTDTPKITDTDAHDPLISLSLPNVLGEDAHLVCRELELNGECPPKSISGDNFLELQQSGQENDNVSEGSYRISDNEPYSTHSAHMRKTDTGQVTCVKSPYEKHVNDADAAVSVNKNEACKVLEKADSSHKVPSSSAITVQAKSTEALLYNSDDVDTNPNISSSRSIAGVHSTDVVAQFSTSAPSALFFQKEVHLPTLSSKQNIDEYAKRVVIGKHTDQRPQTIDDVHDSDSTMGGAASVSFRSCNNDQNAELDNAKKRHPLIQQFPPKATISPLVSQSTNAQVIYTSRGTILQKPKVIYDELTETRAVQPAVPAAPLVRTEKAFTITEKKPSLQQQNVPKTYGATGPLPGRIISRENLIIVANSTKKPKPVVPPKPKNLSEILASQQNFQYGENDKNEKSFSEAIDTEQQQSSATKKLHALVNIQESDISAAMQKSSSDSLNPESTANIRPSSLIPPQDEQTKETQAAEVQQTASHQQQRPTVISIQSEDAPDIQKCHLLNSDVPYVLTVRKITTDGDSHAENAFSTFKDSSTNQAVKNAIAGTETTRISRDKSPDSFNRRKSLDLVQRKRLPSPGSFSSQDHSISPTSLDSGDVLEYLLRRRSASNERSSLTRRAKRGDLRRQTQPVRFNLPPSPDTESQRPSSISQPNLQNEEVEDFGNPNDKEIDKTDSLTNKSTKSLELASTNTLEIVGTLDPPTSATTTAITNKTVRAGNSNVASSSSKNQSEEDVFPPLPELSPTTANVVAESAVSDENLPPPPETPPLPPPPLLIANTQSSRPSTLAEPSSASTTLLQQSELDKNLPFADESVSPRSSVVQNEESSDKQQKSQNTSTLRTPTGLLWTDF
uniref:FERM domain-containing protein n=1 Tax=Syphacia muris TaxID=451379 RepID=A0A0N5APR3_9BILA